MAESEMELLLEMGDSRKELGVISSSKAGVQSEAGVLNVLIPSNKVDIGVPFARSTLKSSISPHPGGFILTERHQVG